MRAVARMLVRRGPVANDVEISNHAGTIIAVILVQARISHTNDLAGAVQIRGKVCGHGVGFHVDARLVIEGRKRRVGSQLHKRGLTQQRWQVNLIEGAFVATAIPGSPLIKDLCCNITEVLSERSARVIGQRNGIQWTGVISPTIHAQQVALKGRFPGLEKENVHQILVQEHPDRNGVSSHDGWVFSSLHEGRRRSLDQQTRRGDEFPNGQAW